MNRVRRASRDHPGAYTLLFDRLRGNFRTRRSSNRYPLPEMSMSLRDALRIPASEVTDESVYRDRRRLLQAFAAAPALALAG